MQPQYFILKGKRIASVDLVTWGKYLETEERHIAYYELPGASICISTVFLGINHNFFNIGKPILFETMIFGAYGDEYQTRYTSYKKAIKGHVEAIKYALLNYNNIRPWESN